MNTFNRREFLREAGALALATVMGEAALFGGDGEAVDGWLEQSRVKADLPALATLALKDGKVALEGAVGVRKAGDPTPVTIQDKFHLGSCTKAMTSHLCALLMEEGTLKREAPLEELLPELKTVMQPAYRKLTFDHLLSQRSGFPHDSWVKGRDFQELRRFTGKPMQQRARYVRDILQEPPEAEPGTRFIYSNRNFALAGYLAEKAAGRGWEELITSRVFTPLGMKQPGFGAMGKPGRVDQPWQHLMNGGKRVLIGPGPSSDNPAAIGPAGIAHMPLADWAKFVADHIAGLRGEKAQLKDESYGYLHTPLFGGNYMGGWIAVGRKWGGGRVFTHNGSNTQNFAVVWMAPLKNFAVMVATNQGGDGAEKACDEVASKVIGRVLG